DDYITKPFAIEELLARIRVALKRRQAAKTPDAKESPTLSAGKDGKLVLDKASHQVTWDGQVIQLTNREFILLQVLMENKSIVLSRDTLLERVWGYDYMGETNVVDVYIYYLRNKIDDHVGEKIIETVRGVGYVIK
ncbi:MAG: response regulator transcription factor, partial [Bacillota bacterium]|nr:response regulator transcription factor [Bacillota bacterium]